MVKWDKNRKKVTNAEYHLVQLESVLKDYYHKRL